MPDKSSAQHGYMFRVIELWRQGKIKPGQIALIEVQHDDQCAIFRSGLCDCNCEVVVPEVGQDRSDGE